MSATISAAEAATDAARTEPIPKKSVQIRTDKPRPHLCAICTRGFARLEHLKRHERAHTNEKPYQCAACGRCFARRDLVLRHQQKLHTEIFQVARRGSLPVTLGGDQDDNASPAANESHVIILRNNTQNKAPLPAQAGMFSKMGQALGFGASATSSPAHPSPGSYAGQRNSVDGVSPRNGDDTNVAGSGMHSRPDSRIDPSFLSAEFGSAPAPEQLPHGIHGIHENHFGSQQQQHSRASGVIPSPNTNSYHNTPNGSGPVQHATGSSFSDLDMLQHHNMAADYTQQPSPLTGDSPEPKESQKRTREQARQAFLNDQLEFKSSLDLKNFASFNKVHAANPTPRHASFSAMSGPSYTNLQDALAIRTTPRPGNGHRMQNIGGIQSHAEGHTDGFTSLGGNGSVLDFAALQVPDFTGGELDWYNMNFGEPKGPHADEGSDPLKKGFKMSLNTIPSESHLAQSFMQNGEESNGHVPNHILAGHQFQDPAHPHHIPGTTPMEFGLEMEPMGGEMPKMAFGTGIESLMDAAQTGTPPGTIGARTTPAEAASEASPAAKRRKRGFVNETDDLQWLEQIRGIPVMESLPAASTSTGFTGMPFITDEFRSDDVFSLFQLKQDDLVRQKSMVDMRASRRSPVEDLKSSETSSRRTSRAQFSIGEPEQEDHPSSQPTEFISEELRAKIVATSNVVDSHFPPIADLNAYMQLYGAEFNPYFSFIHLPTLASPMVDNVENIPMLLAMCAIGALFAYHDSNTLLLFNLSKLHIHRFFETEVTPRKLQSKKVPIMAHQCLVLHIFISMFLNEPNMVDITSRQMNSMVGLIRSTNFHRPLEQFLQPPPAISGPADEPNLSNNYGYFVMAQTRIRTIFTFYQLEVVRSILLGCPLPLSGAEIASGIPSSSEKMWQAETAAEWYDIYSAGEQNIVEVSNNETLVELAGQLHGAPQASTGTTFAKSLALLMHMHEQISASYNELSPFEPFSWRVRHRPRLEGLLDSWEEHFVRHGGSSTISSHNQQLLSHSAELKLILPLSLLARIRLSVNISPVTAAVLHRDWPGMTVSLAGLDNDPEGLREAAKFALDVLELWIRNISVVNDAKQTSVRTPVYFLTAVFMAVVILGKSLDAIENGKSLTVAERAFWLACEKALRSIETTLSAHEESSYSEFLNRQSGGIFGFEHGDAFHKNVQAVLASEGGVKVKSLKKCRLSTRALGLGVRVLADAPLWPLAMRFAEALKHMAMEINGRQ